MFNDTVEVVCGVYLFRSIETISPAGNSGVAESIACIKSLDASSIVQASFLLFFAVFINTIFRVIVEGQ